MELASNELSTKSSLLFYYCHSDLINLIPYIMYSQLCHLNVHFLILLITLTLALHSLRICTLTTRSNFFAHTHFICTPLNQLWSPFCRIYMKEFNIDRIKFIITLRSKNYIHRNFYFQICNWYHIQPWITTPYKHSFTEERYICSKIINIVFQVPRLHESVIRRGGVFF